MRTIVSIVFSSAMIILNCTDIAAQSSTRKPSPATQPRSAPSEIASPPVDTHRSDSLLIALAAQTAEMRRSEDRLLNTILASLGVITTIALALTAYSWFTSNRVYKRDLDSIRDDNRKQLAVAELNLADSNRTAIAQIGDALKLELSNEIRRLAAVQQAESVSINSLTESKLRAMMADYDGALRSALETYSSAQSGNTNYIAHSFDAMKNALELAERDRVHVNDGVLLSIRQTVVSHQDQRDPRVHAVKTALDRQ